MNNATKRFKWETKGKAKESATIVGSFYRFTLITDRLVRIEFDESGIFEDRASQHFFYREQEVPSYTKTIDDDNVLYLETDHIKLSYKMGAEFSRDTLSVRLKNHPYSVWRYGDDPGELGGTASTLDGIDGAIALQKGVISRGGIVMIDDSDSMLLGDDGWIECRRENTKDLYLFAYGHDYKAAIRDMYKVTGAPPLLPDYALGNWWCRYHDYTQEEYESLMEKFEKEKIPLSVAVVDMDWHTVNIPEEQQFDKNFTGVYFGWTGYTWNKELFPDHKAFLKKLHDKNLKVSLNLHPADCCRAHEDKYEEMAKAVGIDPETKQTVKLDLVNPDFMEKYFDILHHPLEDEGVDFWWMDWQQGNDYRWLHEPNRNGNYKNPLEKVTPLWILNHLHILDIARSGKRPMFFSRYAGIGSHRYPVGFSGDVVLTWRSLKFQPYFTATASNVGYGWWSHDVGGTMAGYRDDELQVRWMQFGVLSPITRMHSANRPFDSKEPWNLGLEPYSIVKQWLGLRFKLFPYIYTMNYRNHSDLEPLIQPMYYSHPEQDAAYEVPNQYWFGSELVVAPITEKRDSVDLLAKADVWLPEGDWFDFFTGDRYVGGKKQEVYRTLDKYPVFAKAGAIIPMNKYDGDNKLTGHNELDILVFPNSNGSFCLYEDEGDGNKYQKGHFATTNMTLEWSEKPIFTICGAKGDTKLLPKKRKFNITFRSIKSTAKFNVLVNGSAVKYGVEYDQSAHSATISVIAKVTDEIKIELIGENITYNNADILDRAFSILMHAQASYDLKCQLWDVVQNPSFWTTLVTTEEHEHLLNALKEIINLRNLSK